MSVEMISARSAPFSGAGPNASTRQSATKAPFVGHLR
jgi:hypothetical protein